MPGDCIIFAPAHRAFVHDETRLELDTNGDIILPLLGKFNIAGFQIKEAELQIEIEYVKRGVFNRLDLTLTRCP